MYAKCSASALAVPLVVFLLFLIEPPHRTTPHWPQQQPKQKQ
jgi:hypothetical protein